jgi:ribosome recycling factor
MSHPIIIDMQAKMKNALDHTLHEFSQIHTGKASPTMVESVMVEAYGSMMRLKECAAISTPDARMIFIQPWDKGITQAIAKAIQTANLGLNPSVDGGNVRHPAMDALKKAAKDGKISEDEQKRLEKEVQTATDKTIKDIGDHFTKKEKELTTV